MALKTLENIVLERKDSWSLEQYAEKRQAFRTEVLAHKEHRRVQIGQHILLVFEDEKTIRYQIQEMLRIEKVFEEVQLIFPETKIQIFSSDSINNNKN